MNYQENGLKNKMEEKLKELGVKYEFVQHEAIVDVEEGLKFLGIGPKQGVSTLLMKSKKGYFTVIRRDDHKMDNKKIKKLIGVDDVKMASLDEIKEQLGCEMGYVSLFNPKFHPLIDQSIFEIEFVYGGTGSPFFDLKIKPDDLLVLTGGTKADIAGETIVYGSGVVDKKRVLQGMRPTGRLHLGNYLGTAKGMVQLQNDPAYETFYMVADVHAITTPYKVSELGDKRCDVIIDYMACGLDPDKSALFFQSMVSEHAELAFYFSSVMTVARMQHLPTFKDKAQQYPDHVTMALLNYPILMASDILLYKASMVPVGLDQEPHMEITREIARKMNDQYGMGFPEPQSLQTETRYIPSLTGVGKMSKSVEGSFINLSDDLATIKKRLSGAPTDGGKGDKVPSEGGVANLFKFVELFEGVEKRKQYEEQYVGSGVRYGDLKAELAEAIDKELGPIREKRKELEAKPEYIDKVIKEGAEKARAVASMTVAEVKQKMGLG